MEKTIGISSRGLHGPGGLWAGSSPEIRAAESVFLWDSDSKVRKFKTPDSDSGTKQL